MKYLSAVKAALLLHVLLLLLCSATTDASIFGKAKEDDLYGILGISRSATKQEIKKAFRSITRTHHPDVQNTLEAKEEAKAFMVHVLRAYEVLSDDVKRQEYDQFGKIDGNSLNAADFTAEEIFQYFHMHSPIVSKTQQLDSITLLSRIKRFRGNRIFLIQIYDDTCNSCRWFAPTWETFAQSSLSEGGVVVMLRIDSSSPEGPQLLADLGLWQSKDVQIVGIVDGEKWPVYQVANAVSMRSGREAHSALDEFTMGFLQDRYIEVVSFMPRASADTIFAWLQEPSEALRVLIPPLATGSIPITLSLLHDEATAVVRSAPRESLLHIVEEYCGRSVELRDRAGELLPMPEFLVVVSAPLLNGSHPGERNCRALDIGVSAAMTYRKAAAFVEEHLPKRHADMKDIPHVTGMSFYTQCQKHCLLWLRGNCTEAPNPATLTTLRAGYKPFAVGYICLDTEPALREGLPEHIRKSGGAVVALVDGSDEALYFVPSESASSVAKTLSVLLAGENLPAPMALSGPLSTLLAAQPFPITWLQRMSLLCMWILSYIAPIWKNSYPFLLMYISHRIMRYFNIGGFGDPAPSNNNNSSGSNTNNDSSRSNRHSTETSSASAAARPATNTPVQQTKGGGILTYSLEDMEAAKTGRGFLILLIPHSSFQPVVPSILNDKRFTVRILPQDEKVWRPWLAKHQSTNGGGAETNGFSVVALRKGRMTAAVKPSSSPLESWVCDLIEGTVAASTPIPV